MVQSKTDGNILSAKCLSWTPPDSESPVFKAAIELNAGDSLALSGNSGSGKSSLLRCLVRLLPAEGELRWRGSLVNSVNIRTFRRSVAYVQQRPVALAKTVAENLCFAREMGGPQALDEEAQRRLMDRLNIGGMDLSRRFTSFSIGEQQRVALVRSLTPQPDVLLLDEPTSALDPESTLRVEQLLQEHLGHNGRAMILVSHQPEQLDRLCNKRMQLGESHG